ncbi:MAG: AsmA family protein [Alphaproteobacteria bacterium]|nr:AsmA family protein [Alphaproteobacteria bacterium]
MNKTLRYSLIAVAAVVAVVLLLPFLVPVDSYRGRIETAAESATGRALHIDGPMRLMLFPQFGLKAEKVTFANMPGGRAAAMASIGDIRLAIHFLPLLTGHVVVDQIVLDRPVIALEVNAEGQPNWALGNGKTKSEGSSVTLPLDTQFSGIKITDGQISYTNIKTLTYRAVDHVNATIGITQLDQPVSLDGNLTENGHKIDFDGRIATIKTLLGNGTTALDLSLTSDMMQASFKGLLDPAGTLTGHFKFDTPSLRNMAGWLGEALPAGGGLGRTSLESQIVSKDKVTTFSGLQLTLDHAKMAGHLVIDAHGEVPDVTGALSIDRLDLNPYLLAGTPSAPQPQHSTQSGWSKTPFSFALLKRVDANLSLGVGGLRLRNLHLGKTVLNVTLAGGALTARLDPITLYGGTGQAELDVNGRSAVPVFRNTLKFDNVALRPFLSDTLGVDSIEGSGSLALAITSQGTSAYAVMHALSGKGSIIAGQGRIRGVDLGAVARTIQTVLGGGATGTSATTDFHDMGGSFVIAGGVLANKDFRLSGPLLSMTGAGTIDIGNRAINFRVVPKAAVGGARGLSIGIPFRITGSWDHVHYAPDLTGVVNGLMQNLESGRAPFKGLFGGGNKTKSGQKKQSPQDLLRGLFGQH